MTCSTNGHIANYRNSNGLRLITNREWTHNIQPEYSTLATDRQQEMHGHQGILLSQIELVMRSMTYGNRQAPFYHPQPLG